MDLLIRNKIYLKSPDPELKRYLKDLLTLPNPKWIEAKTFGRWTGGISPTITQFEEEGTQFAVPRGLLQHLLEDLNRTFRLVDQTAAPEAPPWPKSKVKLRAEDQAPAVEEILLFRTGFLSAPAGAGKTVLGLEICRRLGLKALWLTNRTELKDQAISEAVELFGLPKKEIGVLQGKNWRIGDRLTVGMIPSLRGKDLSSLVDTFGVIVVDEAHHVPSSSFLEVLGLFNARHIYGLTATAYRSDKLEQVMFNAVGPIRASIAHVELFEDELLMKPRVRQRLTGWAPIDSHLLAYHDFMEKMVESPLRNQLIASDVKAEANKGHPCIVLVDRTKHAEILTDLIKKAGVKCEFVVSSTDVEGERDKHGNKKKRAFPKAERDKAISLFKEGGLQVLVTTYDLLAEGFNYRPLSRLFLAAPVKWKGTVVQAIGRVQRSCEGKKDAVVYDYVDEGIAMFVRQAEARYFGVYRPMEIPVERV